MEKELLQIRLWNRTRDKAPMGSGLKKKKSLKSMLHGDGIIQFL